VIFAIVFILFLFLRVFVFYFLKPLRCDFCDKDVPVFRAGVNQLFAHYRKSEGVFFTLLKGGCLSETLYSMSFPALPQNRSFS